MGTIRQRIVRCAGSIFLSLAFVTAGGCLLLGEGASASAADGAASPNERLVVRYALDDTATAEGQKLKATKWDEGTQAFVPASNDATISNSVYNAYTGAVASVEGKDGKALSFTGKAHARADFHLPAGATGMTISLWVKNITTYWGSLIEFWDGTNGGRLGKGTMQGNGGRKDEDDPWSANASAHSVGVMADGAGWDSFIVTHNNTNNDNGGAYVDNMKADTWYQVTYTVTSTEMKAYRDGVLKQTFTGKDKVPEILQSIMKAATNQTGGKLGIRLAHDTTDTRADVLDELRIYNGAMTAEEVQALYFEYDPSANVAVGIPDTYEAKGLSYPDLLLGGATKVTDADGKKTGTTEDGVTYTYTPLAAPATPEKDAAGVAVELAKGEVKTQKTITFRRDLGLKATLGYKMGTNGENVAIPTPAEAGDDIVVKLPANANFSQVKAGDIAPVKFAEDNDASHYETAFSYNAAEHIATVRVGYKPFPGRDVFYTIRFEKKSTSTFTSMRIEGGLETLTLAPADFSGNSVNVPVANLADFDLTVTLALAEGAEAEGTYTFTESDLAGGKLAIAITNENGAETTYNLVPVAAPSSDASLTALTAEGYTLAPAFNKDVTEYTVTIDGGDAAGLFAAVTATPAAGATVQKLYDATEHTLILSVKAADGTVRRYTIAVTERDADATLKELKVGDGSVEGFDPAVLAYTVKYKGDAPAVTAAANSAGATVSVGEADASGKVTVTVTAASGAQRAYTVTLLKMSGDASLTKLTINGTELTFTENTAAYRAPLGVRLGELSVSAEAAEGGSVNLSVLAGENKLIVTVTAEDGTSAVYTVNVTPAAAQFAEGGTEDNAPEAGGCNAALGGAGAGIVIAVVTVCGVLLCRKRKTH